ncbi:hypothetical protein LPJ55_002985 [Coemansia sp. RSA 990]|nr:hypothetical protein BX667DRAFT_488370 [Coemansia mojavensis]KAJ1743155.1 hypothetical protein LPJ68_001274 [Coemansia sp. RSA 1086]KAJ1872598.1 hypothetical protein LPJ55_002985 [Coemansia sp. RSA 990]KAJ2674647.1 hypothetical protein IWW42_001493 [Coemansia sp. RSA 1085]
MPSVLVIGCANFYGRAVIQQLCAERDQGSAWVIRGVDKVLPQLASFPEPTLKLYDTIDYRMGNLRNSGFLEQAFERGDSGAPWDYVINLAAEYKFGQTAGVYEQDVHQVSLNIARLAAKHKAGALVHLSTAHLFKPGNSSNALHKEDDEVEAQNELAACHLRAEQDICALSDMPPLVILRPALCYGPGDRQNVVPMMISAQISRSTDQPMPVLWEKDLRVSTVHVDDVARACLAAARWAAQTQKPGSKSVFNLADPGDTTNAKLAQAVGQLFSVKPSFQNSAINFIAKRLKTSELTEEVNESLLGPWMTLLTAHGVANSPLSPYLDQEHPYCRLEHCPLAIDGSRITSTPNLEFSYKHPQVSPQALRPMVEEFQQVKLWPNIPL